MTRPLLSVESLTRRFTRDGRSIAAVDGVSFGINAGETFGICGPSGSGKSTLGRVTAGLLKPDQGRVVFMDENWSELSGTSLLARRRHLQMVFQNPNASFNPRASVEQTVADPLRINGIVPAGERRQEVIRLLERVGLGAAYLARRPHELSGGQRQRVAIARAVACRPRLIVLDEATASLDTMVRASILELLMDLQRELGVAYMLISHDIALVRSVSHRVAILDRGRIVEQGDAERVIDAPASAIGRALVQATPRLWEA